MALRLSWGAPFTEADLVDRPDDGHRYELVDGALVVTPAPNVRHQTCVTALWQVLHSAKGTEHRVFVAPLDVRLSAVTVVQPDVLVARNDDLTEAQLEGPPLLAVEVLSPNTRAIDVSLKRLTYEAAGVPAYWLVDPDVPSLTVLRLGDNGYVDEAVVTGNEAYDADFPFAVTVVPADLLEG